MNRRQKIREIIFRHDTPLSKGFDIILLILIMLSVLAVMIESIEDVNNVFKTELYYLEWAFTILFTIEYGLRVYATFPRSDKYMTSFYGIIDLVSIIPTYISLFVPSSQYLLTIRGLRLLRVFRIFKLTQFFGELEILIRALLASRYKIGVFLLAVVLFSIIIGSVMYMVEGAENGFTSIPKSIYWAIVTMTTVGYGDITPTTDLGKFLATVVMLLGYGVLAVPTGIVTVELSQAQKGDIETVCSECGQENHLNEAKYCHSCSASLEI